MKSTIVAPAALLLIGGGFSLLVPRAQTLNDIKRTDLQRNDLSVPGREVVQVRVDIPAGMAFPRHSHPGEEVVYMLEGQLEYQLDGKPAVTLKPGEVLFIPAGTVHAVKNVAASNGAELATYIVEKGKPLLMPAK